MLVGSQIINEQKKKETSNEDGEHVRKSRETHQAPKAIIMDEQNKVIEDIYLRNKEEEKQNRPADTIRIAVQILSIDIQLHSEQDPFQNMSSQQKILQLREYLRNSPDLGTKPFMKDQYKITDSLVYFDATERRYSFLLRLNKVFEKRDIPSAFVVGDNLMTLIFPQNERGMTWKQHILDKSNYERFEFDSAQKQSSKIF